MRDRTIKVGNLEFKLKIERTKNKHIYAKIKADTVVLRIPSFIKDTKGIEKKVVRRLEEYGLKEIDGRLLSEFILFGKPYKIIVKTINRKYIINHSKRFIVLNPEYRSDFVKYLERKLAEYAKSVIVRYKRILNLSFEPQIVVKPIKSRFGYANVCEKKICLSLFLAFFPKKVVRYIIIHELLHFLVPNHGKKFKLLLSRFIPNYKKLEVELRKFFIIVGYNKNLSDILVGYKR